MSDENNNELTPDDFITFLDERIKPLEKSVSEKDMKELKKLRLNLMRCFFGYDLRNFPKDFLKENIELGILDEEDTAVAIKAIEEQENK